MSKLGFKMQTVTIKMIILIDRVQYRWVQGWKAGKVRNEEDVLNHFF